MLAAGVNTLIIDRGNTKNTVNQMNDFIANKKDSLFLFPQGMLGSHTTLTKFRTGAFATNYNVQPVVLKYKQDVSVMTFFQMVCFPRVDVEVIVLDEVPRDVDEKVENYCERIRVLMAKAGNLEFSRVDSHDIREEAAFAHKKH